MTESYPFFLAEIFVWVCEVQLHCWFLGNQDKQFSVQFMLNGKKLKRKKATLNILISVESTKGLNLWLVF